jgi:hypothetical protein
MSYYKFISDGNIIDAIEDPVWVKENSHNIIVRCDIREATGVVSSDMSSILHIAGTKDFSDDSYAEIAIADITKDEYEELKVLLNLGAKIADGNDDVRWDGTEENASEEISENVTLIEVKERCLAKLSEECQNTIYEGVDVCLSDSSVRHFALEIEDQLNLLTLATLVANGETVIPYHASGELCTYYSAEDITRIVEAATAFKTYHTSYYNSLKNWVLSMDSIASVGAVQYGDLIPTEYCSDVFLSILQSMNSEDKNE